MQEGGAVTQILKEPPVPYGQTLMLIVSPGVNDDKLKAGIKLFTSSLHSISVRLLQGPEYAAIAASVMPSSVVFMNKLPLGGTTA